MEDLDSIITGVTEEDSIEDLEMYLNQDDYGEIQQSEKLEIVSPSQANQANNSVPEVEHDETLESEAPMLPQAENQLVPQGRIDWTEVFEQDAERDIGQAEFKTIEDENPVNQANPRMSAGSDWQRQERERNARERMGQEEADRQRRERRRSNPRTRGWNRGGRWVSPARESVSGSRRSSRERDVESVSFSSRNTSSGRSFTPPDRRSISSGRSYRSDSRSSMSNVNRSFHSSQSSLHGPSSQDEEDRRRQRNGSRSRSPRYRRISHSRPRHLEPRPPTPPRLSLRTPMTTDEICYYRWLLGVPDDVLNRELSDPIIKNIWDRGRAQGIEPERYGWGIPTERNRPVRRELRLQAEENRRETPPRRVNINQRAQAPRRQEDNQEFRAPRPVAPAVVPVVPAAVPVVPVVAPAAPAAVADTRSTVNLPAPFLRTQQLEDLFRSGRVRDSRPLPVQQNQHLWLQNHLLHVTEEILEQALHESGRELNLMLYRTDPQYRIEVEDFYWRSHGLWEGKGEFFSGYVGAQWIDPDDQRTYLCRETPKSHYVLDNAGRLLLLQKESVVAFRQDGNPVVSEVYRELLHNETPSHSIESVSGVRLPQPIFPAQMLRPRQAEAFDAVNCVLNLADDIEIRENYHIFKKQYLDPVTMRNRNGSQPRYHFAVEHQLPDGTTTTVYYACQFEDCCSHCRPGLPYKIYAETFCAFCGGSHTSLDCPSFDTPGKREYESVAKRLCFRCGLKGHKASVCHKKIDKCRYCGRRHWAAVCTSVRAWIVAVKKLLMRKKLAYLPSIQNLNILVEKFRFFESVLFQRRLVEYRENNYFLDEESELPGKIGVVPFRVLAPYLNTAVNKARQDNNSMEVYYSDAIEEDYRLHKKYRQGRVMDFTFLRQHTISSFLEGPWQYQTNQTHAQIAQMQNQSTQTASIVENLRNTNNVRFTFTNIVTALPDDLLAAARDEANRW